MAESVHEQIAAQLRNFLAGIVGDGGVSYWYTPDRVVRVTYFEEEPFDTSLDTIYLIRPGDEQHAEESTGTIAAQMEVWLIVARRHAPPTENPYQETAPTRWQVINRLVQDLLKKLQSDVTLGGLAYNTNATVTDVDRARFVPAWALAEVRMTISYSYGRGLP